MAAKQPNRIISNMGVLLDIDPYDLHTIQECDDAIALVYNECVDIENQIENPDEDWTIGWLRRAKASLGLGRGLKQRLQNRRAEIYAGIKQERQNTIDRSFVNHAKKVLTREQFHEIRALVEAEHPTEQKGEL